MQADTDNRFVNMQIFAMLLSCIRKICAERLIGHLAMVDIEGVSHDWYGDFFRLAGFSRCRCHSSASSALQLGPRKCLALREPLDRGFSAVYERIGTWLAEGRCTRNLLDSVASGQAAEVERKYFHDLLAEIGDERPSQGVLMRPKPTIGDTMRTRRPWPKSVKKLATAKTRAQQQHQIETARLAEQRPSPETMGKSMTASAYKVVKKRKQSGKGKRKRAVGVHERHKLSDIGIDDHTGCFNANF